MVRVLFALAWVNSALLVQTPLLAQASPYVEHAERQIKALSGDEIASLLAGEGMGFALAGELNGYPGPRHVLDLSDSLALTNEQGVAANRIFDVMQRDAIPLGQTIVALEAQLDSAFARKEITEARLQGLTDSVALARAKLRYVHLRAHLRITELLTDHQVMEYARLRGYQGGATTGHGH